MLAIYKFSQQTKKSITLASIYSNLILLRSLQNHTEHGLGQNLNTSNELMMAEINFLEAKKYLADAHAR